MLGKQIRVGIVESSRLIRESLVRTLALEHDMIVAAVSSAETEFETPPDVVLVQNLSSRAFRELAGLYPSARIVVINADVNALSVVECARLDIAGFVLPDACQNELARAIRTVATGGTVVPAAVALNLWHELREKKDGPSFKSGQTTIRQRQIIALIAQGLSNKEIAYRLNITTHTVKTHVHNLLDRLQFRSRIDLVNCYWTGRSALSAPGVGSHELVDRLGPPQ